MSKISIIKNEMNLKSKIQILASYFLILFLFDLLFRDGQIGDKLLRYGKTLLVCFVGYMIVYLFSCFMVKNPLSSQKVMKVILRTLASILFVCAILYGIYYFWLAI